MKTAAPVMMSLLVIEGTEPQNEYVFLGGRRIAQSNPSSGSVYYYFADHLGSTRAATNATGAACYEADFLPYGTQNTPASFSNTCSTNYKFTGYERDSETGLDYAFARYYNQRMGRFQSGDPLDGDITDPQTLNRYAYARNNPINLIDPSGMSGCPPDTAYSVCVSADNCNNSGDCDINNGNGGGNGSPSFPGQDIVETPSPDRWRSFGCIYLRICLGLPAPQQPQTPGLLSRIATSLCAVVPDAVTAGGGGDIGLGITFGIQGGIVANGSSGEVSFFDTGTTSLGFIGPDFYAALGIVSKAPTNSSLNSNGQPSKGLAGGIGRSGFQATSNSFQGTFGPSLLPGTAAYQASLTNVSKSVPYLGYLLNPPRAICKAVTGN